MKSPNRGWILFVLIMGIGLVAFAPYIILRIDGIDAFKDTGSIGDTIGGMTAPFTSLIGSILVYFALKSQIEANNLIQLQFKTQQAEDDRRQTVQHLTSTINLVNSDLNDLMYVNGYTNSEFYGAQAILNRLEEINQTHDCSVDKMKLTTTIEIWALLSLFESTVHAVKNAIITYEDKAFMISQLEYLFSAKIDSAFSKFNLRRSSELSKCGTCKKYHRGIPDPLMQKADSIYKALQEKIQ